MSDQTPAVQHAMQLPPKITDSHIFFFGNDTGSELDCLSQWYQVSFLEPENDPDQQKFSTTEHYMMYCKAKLMGDQPSMDAIHEAATPHEAKVLGRGIKPYNGQLWQGNCDEVVERGNYLKFSQNPRIAEKLMSTGDRELVEGNPEDRIWGAGFDNEMAGDHESEWGHNKLGKALMRVRARLQTEH